MKFKPQIIIGALIVSLALKAFLHFSHVDAAISWTAAITLFTAILWVTEALPIPATSLIPFFAFPITGVLTHKEAASALGSHVILLLMGAFMLSKAVEVSGVHRRFAIKMLRVTGGNSEKKLVLAFMLTAAILSMWISNTATTLMLLPIALAILEGTQSKKLATALLLGIAYAASLGGVGTPVGTPPNIIFISVYSETQSIEYTFLQWMKTGVPIVIIAIPLMALWLTRNLSALEKIELPESGAWRAAEKRVLWVFAVVVMAWMFRPYWTAALGLQTIGDSTIALAGVIAMFLVPSGNEKKETLLTWEKAADIPWGMLLLFAGGICIAKAFMASGLSEQAGELLQFLQNVPLFVLILCLCLFVTFLTEITSNTATATLLMPILAVSATAIDVDPALLMIPAAISASCAFMLPVATAPNAIVYSTDKFSISDMAKEGFVLNIIVAVVITAVAYTTLS
ncbi:MAG: SLC13 family permease [Aestuariibacter sp.]